MTFKWVFIVAVFSALAGATNVKSICPSDVIVGQRAELTCEINGGIESALRWHKSDSELIVLCNSLGICDTPSTSLYSPNNITNNVQKFTILKVSEDDLTRTWTCVDGTSPNSPTASHCKLSQKPEPETETDAAISPPIISSCTVAVILVIVDVIIYLVFKDNLSKVRKIYIIYCVVDVLVVGIVCGVSIYYIYLRTSDIGIIAGTCISFLVVSTVIKIIVVKTELFSKCS